MSKILIIEDEATIRGNTAELLQLEGYIVSTVSNGKEGLEIIIQTPPDLILCDLLMPEMDGYAVLAYLGKQQDLKRIPFIFFSGKSDKADITKGLSAGANDYLVKPFELEQLLASIEKCLHRNKSF